MISRSIYLTRRWLDRHPWEKDILAAIGLVLFISMSYMALPYLVQPMADAWAALTQ